jgi:hypothetical protein
LPAGVGALGEEVGGGATVSAGRQPICMLRQVLRRLLRERPSTQISSIDVKRTHTTSNGPARNIAVSVTAFKDKDQHEIQRTT